MRIVGTKVELIDEKDCYKKIELAGRTCYKSENLMTTDSAVRMVKNFISSGHLAMIEHASMCFKINENARKWFKDEIIRQLEDGHRVYLRMSTVDDTNYVSGNCRAWREFCLNSRKIPSSIFWALYTNENLIIPDSGEVTIDAKSQAVYEVEQIDPEIIPGNGEHLDLTVRITCDRGVTHEIVRHRPASYAQESTRYCNYSKNKFDSSISVIDIASGFDYDLTDPNTCEKYLEWNNAMKDAETHYMNLIKLGATAQEARSVLPNSLKTEIVMTANIPEWKHFFKLRCDKSAHPQMQEVATLILECFRDNGYADKFKDLDF